MIPEMEGLKTHPRWIAAVTQPQREMWARENVERQGHEACLPMCREQLVRNGSLKVIERPLFPRYLFVRVTVQWRFLTGTFGVIGVILDGEAPAVVSDSAIDEIAQAAGPNGILDIVPKTEPDIRRGTRVRIVSGGPFRGLVGTFVGMSGDERVRVLLSMFGRQSTVRVMRSAIRVA